METSTGAVGTATESPASTWQKCLAALLCFGATLVSGLFFNEAFRKTMRLMNMTFLIALSVGVFSALLLNDFFPETIQLEHKLRGTYKNFPNFPLVGPIVLFGIILMFVSDQVIHKATGHSHEMEPREDSPASKSSHKIWLLLIGIGIHSLLEGMPIGIEKKHLWTIAVSLSIHKCIEAATIASAMVEMNRMYCYVIISIYSAMSPIGILTGAFLSASPQSLTVDLLTLILMSLSTGVIIFLAFVEMLPKVIECERTMLVTKIMCIVCGYSAVTGAAISFNLYFGDHTAPAEE
uniref:Zinc transporter ZIP3 n=1 Tax=Caenorhabditis tropicalis TaxID=1561998 RepID=A0A1I7UEY5_9PELO